MKILKQVQADRDLVQRFVILTSIPGLSAITAFALLIEMPELGALEPGQAASLAGLAPMTRQSGRWTGRAFIRGGLADIRQALYMPALVAASFNPDMKAKYKLLTSSSTNRLGLELPVPLMRNLPCSSARRARAYLTSARPQEVNGPDNVATLLSGTRPDQRWVRETLAPPPVRPCP